MTTPTCPQCGQPATQHTERELSDHQHEVTGVCTAGHLWVTRWFAAREVA